MNTNTCCLPATSQHSAGYAAGLHCLQLAQAANTHNCTSHGTSHTVFSAPSSRRHKAACHTSLYKKRHGMAHTHTYIHTGDGARCSATPTRQHSCCSSRSDMTLRQLCGRRLQLYQHNSIAHTIHLLPLLFAAAAMAVCVCTHELHPASEFQTPDITSVTVWVTSG